MSRRDRDTTDAGSDVDSYGLLFDTEEPRPEAGWDEELPSRPSPTGRASRVDRGRATRRRRRRRVVWTLTSLMVAVLALVAWFIVLPVYRYLHPSNYSGAGSGTVLVTVLPNDGASDIGDALKAKGVVASVRAFTNAANDDAQSRTIQPGTYRLHEHMSGVDALKLMLTPSARLRDDVVVTEGATILDVQARMTAKPCQASANASAQCGPGYAAAAVKAAFADVSAAGIPPNFLSGGAVPKSVEGFLYPATYFFPEDGKPADALQQMITEFSGQLRTTDFVSRAKVNGFTPYQQLIAASIAQSEAKYPADMAKVVRVILNRIKSNTPLRIDATSAYAAKLQGLDPTKVIYAQIDSPYNTYTHSGLPPTPISNPGAQALTAAAHPAAGNWLFYVNKDAAGHLFFTNSETAFAKAVATCVKNHWGCG